eukprot:Gb_33710 [translate_table: standard]
MIRHLKGQAYARATRICKIWETDCPWDIFEDFKRELEFEESRYYTMKNYFRVARLKEPDNKKEDSTIEVASPNNKSSNDSFNKLTVKNEDIIETATKWIDEEENPPDKEPIEEEDNFDYEEMDHKENYCDKEDYDPGSYDKTKDDPTDEEEPDKEELACPPDEKI